MLPRRHAVFTVSDSKFGDFVIDHWLGSLQANVDLSDVDVHVLDYGLTPEQLQRLNDRGVHCHRCVRDGHVTNIRYRDMAAVLEQGNYDQVLLIDGGDIIFQTDIRPLMDENREHFRAVCHEFEVPFHEVIMSKSDFSSETYRKMMEFLRDKRTINGGVLLGPAKLMKELWPEFTKWASSFNKFGIDQLLLNHALYSQGFVELDAKYNYTIIAREKSFSIRKGVFYNAQNEIIPIVHNSGIYDVTRPIARFGFGPDRNRKRIVVPTFLRTLYKCFNTLRPATVRLKRANKPQTPSSTDDVRRDRIPMTG